MSMFENIFYKLFGRRNNSQPPNDGLEKYRQPEDRFRNPIWQTDDDDDDDEAGDFSRKPRGGMHFRIFTDPMEITQYFESQMDGMLNDFFHGFGQGFGMTMEPFHEHGSLPALPPTQSPHKSLRNEVLKPGYENPLVQEEQNSKLDLDLDGKISAGELSKIWKEPSSLEPIEPSKSRHPLSFSIFGQSVSSQTIRRPDGTMEHRKTITHSDGSIETSITRQIGDTMHTIKTKKDKDGVETKTEDFINIDENQLPEFDQKWQRPISEPRVEPGKLNKFPWHKFFSFEPKL